MPLDVFSPYLSCADIAVATRTASIAAVTAIVTICFRFMTGPFRSLPVPREHRQRPPPPRPAARPRRWVGGGEGGGGPPRGRGGGRCPATATRARCPA